MTPDKANLDRGFSDADLDKLIDNCTDNPLWVGTFGPLIKRLHAAERCCELTYFHFGGKRECNPMELELRDSSEAWLRSKGLPPSGDGEKGQ